MTIFFYIPLVFNDIIVADQTGIFPHCLAWKMIRLPAARQRLMITLVVLTPSTGLTDTWTHSQNNIIVGHSQDSLYNYIIIKDAMSYKADREL